MQRFVSPEFNRSAFNCPHCGAYAKMNWSDTSAWFGQIRTEIPITACRCSHCNQDSYWLSFIETDGKTVKHKMVIPQTSMAPLPHPDMPINIKSDYSEARSIVNDSPRGSSALLRLCIQKLCVHLGESGENLNTDIGNLVSKGLPIEIQQALDIVRVVGNNAVHPGELDEEDVAEIAISLFDLVNEIVEDRIARPEKLKGLFDRLPTSAKDAIDKRNGKDRRKVP